MPNYQEQVQVGHSVWHDFKNGVVESVDYLNDTVFVNFYDKGYQSFDRDVFIGCYDERLNQWVLGELA